MTGTTRNGFHLTAFALLLAFTSTTADSAWADEPQPDFIAAAVAHPARSAADLARDLHSQPEAVLRFLGIRPAMTVLDLLAGDGYYSEILARAVGSEGVVYLHNNQAYAGLMRNLPRRLRGSDLEALEVYVREIADINLPSDSVDLVLMVKVYHDLYYLNNGWAVSPDEVFRTLHRVLKADGVLAVIDHRAPHGTGSSYAQDLHRIAADFAREDIENRGFRFDGEITILENPKDELDRSVFDVELRGRTDRFVHRYRKSD